MIIGFIGLGNLGEKLAATLLRNGLDLIIHDKFKEKYKVKFDLLSDEKKEALKAFKVWGKKKFMGKEFMGVIRSTFVIKNNKIIKEWRSVKVKDHAKEVLEFIKKIN